MRPGWLYFALFSWLATQGRFTSLLLGRLMEDRRVGVLLAIRPLCSLLSPLLVAAVDALEQRGSPVGRAAIMAACALATSFFFLCHLIPETLIWKNAVGEDSERVEQYDFIFFLVVRGLYSIAVSPIYALMDGITLEYLVAMGMEKSSFGTERMFGAISWAIVNLIMGFVIDQYDVRIMILFNLVFLVPFLICLYYFEVSRISQMCQGDAKAVVVDEEQGVSEEPSSTAISVYSTILRKSSPTFIAFLVLITVLSMGTSIVENLVFLMFTNSLGASNFICGVTVVVTVVFEIPVFYFSNSILAYFGSIPLLCIATLSYAVRVVGYTLIPKSTDWEILFLEPLHGVTFGCSKLASVDFMSAFAPDGYQASGQALLGALQGVGGLIGTSAGGEVEEMFGYKTLYRAAAAAVFSSQLLFLCIYWMTEWSKRNSRSTSNKSVEMGETIYSRVCKSEEDARDAEGKGCVD